MSVIAASGTPDLVLTTLKFVFLALLYLFVARALRVIWLDLSGPRAPRAKAAPPAHRPVRAAARAAGAKPRALLVVEEGMPPRTYPMTGEPITIGRADECTVVLSDNYVSQLHTKLYTKDGQWLVMDCGSTNGTFLNHVRIADPAPVAAGDHVRLGKTILEVRAK